MTNHFKKYGLLYIYISLVVIIWFVYACIGPNYINRLPKENATWYQNQGQFGDMFGALNTLFTGLAFAGLLYTIHLQRKDLETQAKRLDQQDFNNTFFEILRRLMDIAKSFPPRDSSGTGALNQHYHYMLEHLKRDPPPQNPKDLQNRANDYFKNSVLRIYFRTFHCLLTFIDTAKIDNKSFYIDLVLAQLSRAEQQLIFYFCLLEEEIDFKKLIEKYSLFKNMPRADLIAKEHAELYTKQAFDTN